MSDSSDRRSPLVSATELADAAEVLTLLDVRWKLGGPPGLPAYLGGHIPGASYVDLDSELADPPGPGGRHPLPAAARFGRAMQRAGVRRGRRAVVYDDGDGSAAARAWWLLRYFGHPNVRVLDGGLAAWTAAGRPLATGAESGEESDFTPRPGHLPVLDANGAADLARLGVLLDCRIAARYRGEVEPVDPVAGHIPGALNAPAGDVLADDGRLKDPTELARGFTALGVRPELTVGAYCGSGVTASLQVLALEVAGIPAALYAGSWSDWITDPARPVATGSDPG